MRLHPNRDSSAYSSFELQGTALDAAFILLNICLFKPRPCLPMSRLRALLKCSHTWRGIDLLRGVTPTATMEV